MGLKDTNIIRKEGISFSGLEGIFSNVDGKAASTDAVDGDVVSIAGSTIDAGNENVGNGQLDISASKVWAPLFTVEVQ